VYIIYFKSYYNNLITPLPYKLYKAIPLLLVTNKSIYFKSLKAYIANVLKVASSLKAI
jgi:hypothetical protein